LETKSNSLLKNTLLYSIGNLASKGLSFILVFFTTFYLSREDVGIFDLFLTSLGLLTPLVTLQLTDAVLRWLIANNDLENKSRVLTTASFILLISVFTTIVVILIFQSFYSFAYYKELLFLLGFQSFFLLFQQFQRAIADNKGYVLSSVFYTFIYVFLAILFLVFYDKKIEGLLYSNIIAAFFSTVFIVFRNKVFSYIHSKYYSFQVARELLCYSIPLVPNSLSWWAISSANRYLIVLF
jgi:O-antigen/teichoic acid export membrane protein